MEQIQGGVLGEADDNDTRRPELEHVDEECRVHAFLPERQLVMREEPLDFAVQSAADVHPDELLVHHVGRFEGNIDQGLVGAQQGELHVKFLLSGDGLEINTREVKIFRFSEVEGELVSDRQFVETGSHVCAVVVGLITLRTKKDALSPFSHTIAIRASKNGQKTMEKWTKNHGRIPFLLVEKTEKSKGKIFFFFFLKNYMEIQSIDWLIDSMVTIENIP